MHTASKEPETDSLSQLAPVPNETALGWFARIRARIAAWWRKPRSRIGLLIVGVACLAQGCRTSTLGPIVGAVAGVTIYHNYLVAEAEAWEREEVEAGRTPLRVSNGDLVKSHAWGYALSGAAGGVAGHLLSRGDDDKDENTTYNVTNNTYPPDPAEAEPEAAADAGAGE